MRHIAILALSAALTACAGQVIKDGMTKMVGQPLSVAIAKLGHPTEERVIAGQKVYVWLTRTMDEGTELKCQIRVIMQGEVIGTFDYDVDGRCGRYVSRLM